MLCFLDFSFNTDDQSYTEISGLSMIDKGCSEISAPFYVTVYGVSASIFSLTVHPVAGGSAVAISPGVPLSGSISVSTFMLLEIIHSSF